MSAPRRKNRITYIYRNQHDVNIQIYEFCESKILFNSSGLNYDVYCWLNSPNLCIQYQREAKTCLKWLFHTAYHSFGTYTLGHSPLLFIYSNIADIKHRKPWIKSSGRTICMRLIEYVSLTVLGLEKSMKPNNRTCV